jgi:hypothetical protein
MLSRLLRKGTQESPRFDLWDFSGKAGDEAKNIKDGGSLKKSRGNERKAGAK